MQDLEPPTAGPERRTSLSGIVSAPRPVTYLVAAAGLFALSFVLAGLAYAVLSATGAAATRALATAASWIGFAAAGAALGAVSLAAWRRALEGAWQAAAETVAAAVTTLVFTIGLLVVAADSPNGSAAGSVVAAVGLGGWAALTLVNAAGRSIAEQAAGLPRQADLWLAATGVLVVLAVAVGLPAPTTHAAALPIADSVLFLVAFAGLALVVREGRGRLYMTSRALPALVAGLALVAVSYLAAAVADGFVFSSSAKLTTVRIGLSLPPFVEAVGWAVVALAAFERLSELCGTPARTGWRWGRRSPLGAPPSAPATGWDPPAHQYRPQEPPPEWVPPPPTVPVDTGLSPTVQMPTAVDPGTPPGHAEVAEHCGAPLPHGAAFCPRCGQPVSPSGNY